MVSTIRFPNWFVLFFILASLLPSISTAKPYLPNDDDVLIVVDKTDLAQKYRDNVKNNLGNKKILIQETKKIIEQAKKNKDDLLYGKIEAVLQQHKTIVDASNELKVYMAYLLQHRHDFYQAKQYLRNVNTVKANLLRSVLYSNLGEYKKSAEVCKKLLGKTSLLVASTCLLHANSFNGNLKVSYSALLKIERHRPRALTEHKVWAYTALADMSKRLGRSNDALAWYKKANQLSNADAHIVSAWTDILFELNEHDKVISLLRDNHQDLRLNLRYLRSLLFSNQYRTKDHGDDLNSLSQAIKIAELRKDLRHYDTRAEYYTWIKPNAEKAQYWANKNWAVSKTPVSARLLLLTSQKINEYKKIRQIEYWINKNKIEDYYLHRLTRDAMQREILI